MLCSRCKKRSAILFVSTGTDKTGAQGLCGPCAEEIGSGPLKDIIGKIGISEKDLSDMQEKVSEMFDSEGGIEIDIEPEVELEEGEEEEDFSPGGSKTFPMIKNLFSNILFPDKDENNGNSKETSGSFKNKKKSQNVCINW